jgi:hypothetical protein
LALGFVASSSRETAFDPVLTTLGKTGLTRRRKGAT